MKLYRVRVLTVIAVVCISFLFVSCATTMSSAWSSGNADAKMLVTAKAPAYPDAFLMSISDTHLFDKALGSSGKEWDNYLKHDRKLLLESEEILQQAIARIIAAKPEFVLVSGDLTKDGEKQNHLLFASYLRKLKDAGIQSYVIDGNHDINNPHSVRFTPEGTKPVEHTDPAMFAEIYSEFGYGQALSRDPASLSYVVEPKPGLWLLAVDTVRHDENLKRTEPVTGGRVRPATLAWIESRLQDAVRQGKAVMIMQHHGLIEHFAGQKQQFDEYVVENDIELARLYAAYHVHFAFTGHFHANDIAGRWYKEPLSAAETALAGRWIMDVETGSLVTWPSSIRTMRLQNGDMQFNSDKILNLPSFEAEGKDFGAYSRKIIADGVSNIAVAMLTKIGCPVEEAQSLTQQISAATIAHYRGDEHFVPNNAEFGTNSEMLRSKGLSFMGGIVVNSRRYLVEGLWSDPLPGDNTIIIHPDGTWEQQ